MKDRGWKMAGVMWFKHAGFDWICILLQWAHCTSHSGVLQWGTSAVKQAQWAELVFSWRHTTCSRVSLTHCKRWPNPSWHVDNKELQECFGAHIHEQKQQKKGLAVHLERHRVMCTISTEHKPILMNGEHYMSVKSLSTVSKGKALSNSLPPLPSPHEIQ